jgi:hypothetical protein
MEALLLPADPKPNVLMDWIVANDVIRPNIILMGHMSVLVVERYVISMQRGGRRMNRGWSRWSCRNARREASKAYETSND